MWSSAASQHRQGRALSGARWAGGGVGTRTVPDRRQRRPVPQQGMCGEQQFGVTAVQCIVSCDTEWKPCTDGVCDTGATSTARSHWMAGDWSRCVPAPGSGAGSRWAGEGGVSQCVSRWNLEMQPHNGGQARQGCPATAAADVSARDSVCSSASATSGSASVPCPAGRQAVLVLSPNKCQAMPFTLQEQAGAAVPSRPAHRAPAGLGTRWIPHLRQQQRRAHRPGLVC